jgi:putative MATE family efflux protein
MGSAMAGIPSPSHPTSAAAGDGNVMEPAPPSVKTWLFARRSRHDREIVRLTVPSLATLAVEPLLLISDGVIVGHLGTAELAGVSLASALLINVVYLLVFLGFGTTAAVGRYLGAGDLRAALSAGLDALWLAFAVGVLLLIAGQLVGKDLLLLLGNSGAAEPFADDYFRISVVGLPAILLVFAGMGLLRGLGDAKFPLLVAVGTLVSNVALSLLLVYGAGLGVVGCALGTTLAQSLGAAVLCARVVVLAQTRGLSLRPRLPRMAETAIAGLPLLARTFTLRIALLAMTFVATSLGMVTLAAYQLVLVLSSASEIVAGALGIAGQILVSQHLGRGSVDDARATTRRLVQWGVILNTFLGLGILVLQPVLLEAFTSDAAVVAAAGPALLVLAAIQPLGGVVFVLDGALMGAGDGRFLARAGLLALCLLLPLLGYVYASGAGLSALWWSWGAYLLVRSMALLAREHRGRWLITGASR